jgi:hypothetical protein
MSFHKFIEKAELKGAMPREVTIEGTIRLATVT